MTITRTSWGQRLPLDVEVGSDWWLTRGSGFSDAPSGWLGGGACGSLEPMHGNLRCTRNLDHGDAHAAGIGGRQVVGEWGMRRELRRPVDYSEIPDHARLCNICRPYWEQEQYWARNARGTDVPVAGEQPADPEVPTEAPSSDVEAEAPIAPPGYLPADLVRDTLLRYSRRHSDYVRPIKEGLRNLGITEFPEPSWTATIRLEIPVALSGEEWLGLPGRSEVRDHFGELFPTDRITEVLGRYLRSAKSKGDAPLGLAPDVSRAQASLQCVERES